MDLEHALQTFLAESRELLEEMESALLAHEEAAEDVRPELVNAIFRAAHTIKGSAGLFGLDGIVGFTHVVESLLDEVRSGRRALDAGLVPLLLSARDHLGALVDTVAAGRDDVPADLRARGESLLALLGTGTADGGGAALVAPPSPETPVPGCWHLSLRFGSDVLRHGMDPMAFIRYLRTLGRIVRVVTVAEALPVAADMDPESCYLGFEIALETAADKAAIESVFEFVLDDCSLRLIPPASRIEEYVSLILALPEEPALLGEILARCGSVTPHEIRRALQAQTLDRQQAPAAAPRLGDILVGRGEVPPRVVEAALAQQRRSRERQSIRVEADKLDRLIDLVGELIIVQAGASQAARQSGDAGLAEAHAALEGLVQAVRDSAMQLRMVKIGATFGRFQRVVHDVSREIGKRIELQVSGEDTELDKTIVEKIADPLTHLVRNAMDHGIESPERRAAAGKPAQGLLRLHARHEAGGVLIEVADDGGGLDRERILAKGRERGLVAAEAELSDSQVFGLIFEAGFSTAEQVTNLSGRGVGMDVVRRNINELRGTVEIASQPGTGTTVRIRLPLTLAIIDGFQVRVGDGVFVLPLELVEECIEHCGDGGRDCVDLRGSVLPLIRLRRFFELPGAAPARQSIVVLRHGEARLGLVVDSLLGEAQTVIKPLSPLFAQVRGISGTSIRGSGEVVLILDVPALVQAASVPTGAASRAH